MDPDANLEAALERAREIIAKIDGANARELASPSELASPNDASPLALALNVLAEDEQFSEQTGRTPEQLRAAAAWVEKVVDLANELSELTLALDEWLGKGGHLPHAWSSVAWQNGVTLAQAITLGGKVKPLDTMHVTMGGAGLSEDRLLVTYTNDKFVLGIDREGSASS